MFERLWRPTGTGLRVSALALLLLASTHLIPASTSEDVSRGSILVAAESLRDPNFRASLVLIVGSDNLGTIGLIVNRPTTMDVATALPALAERANGGAAVFFGGPVQIDGYRVLARSTTTVPDAIHVVADIYFVDNPDALDYVLDELGDPSEYRFFAGISSWIPGQLEAEIRAGAWQVLPFEPELVLSADPESLWPRIIDRLKAQWVMR